MDIVLFAIKLCLFNIIYCIAIGVALLVVCIPLMLLKSLFKGSLDEEPDENADYPWWGKLAGVIVGLPISAVHGIIAAAGAAVSLTVDSSRLSLLYWCVGLLLAPPLALGSRSLRKSEAKWSALGAMTAYAAFVFGMLWPSLIPSPLLELGARLAV
jgi:hypothetical protein